MNSLMIYFAVVIVFIVVIVLLSMIKDKVGRIVSVLMVMILLMSATTFVLFKISGQQSFFKTFDAFTGNTNQNDSNLDDSTSDINEEEAVSVLHVFLYDWQHQNIDDLATLITDNASRKLESELPLGQDPTITDYEIISIGTYDLKTGVLPISVKVTILYQTGTIQEIIFNYDLSYSNKSWHIMDGKREDNEPDLFSFSELQEMPANTPTPTPTPIPTLPPNNTGETTEDMITNFLNVALDEDDAILRWEIPIEVEIKGDFTETDYNRIIDELDYINDLDALPPISVVEADGNFIIYFVPQNEMPDILPQCDPDYVYYVEYEENENKLYEAICLIASDANNQKQRNYSVLCALTYSLGLIEDGSTYEDSILQSDWTEIQSYSDVDYYMLQLLYSDRIKAGMNRQEAQASLMYQPK